VLRESAEVARDAKQAATLAAERTDETDLSIAIAAGGVACGPGASDSHNSSQAGATARAGAATDNRQQPVTLTGCLQNADKPGATAPTGTSGIAARPCGVG
jgi:hypothetical protein